MAFLKEYDLQVYVRVITYNVYWAEDTVLYSFYLRFIDQENQREEAEKLMLEWMESF